MKHTIVVMAGGVGTGKSYLCQQIALQYHVTVLSCDALARTLMQPGKVGYVKACELFGKKIVGEDGCLQRDLLRQILFAESSKRAVLNQTIYPAVIDLVKDKTKKSENPIVLIESAVAKEAGLDRIADRLFVVVADDETRRRRLRESRGYTEEMITAMMLAQQGEASLLEEADLVLDNSEGHDCLPQLLQAIEAQVKS